MMGFHGKSPLHQHEHPIYPWIALFVSLFVILGLAGWYYLVNLDTLNAEIDSVVKNSFSTTKSSTTTSSTSTTTSVDQATVEQTITAVEKQIDGASNSDFADDTLNDSTIGVSN